MLSESERFGSEFKLSMCGKVRTLRFGATLKLNHEIQENCLSVHIIIRKGLLTGVTYSLGDSICVSVPSIGLGIFFLFQFREWILAQCLLVFLLPLQISAIKY